MDKFHAFIECTNRQATYRVSRENQGALARTHLMCGAREDSALFLCEECAVFHRECVDKKDHSAWHLAVFLRELLPSSPFAPTH